MNTSPLPERHQHQSVRRVPVRRDIEVLSVSRITPHMQRIVFGGTALEGFDSAAPDDHIKLFFPNPQGEWALPTLGPDGAKFPAGVEPSPMRDYTPRHFDPHSLQLTIDFVIHGDGPASTWAEQAKVGDPLHIGGPRGSFVMADDFDHYVLVGDETALPAIGRRLEEMQHGHVHVLAEIPDARDRQPFQSKVPFEVIWLERDGNDSAHSTLLETALREQLHHDGDTFYWIACESRRARNMRKFLNEDCGITKEWIRSSGYWKADGSDEED